MKLLGLAMVTVAGIAAGALAAVPAVTPAQKAAICGKRTSCAITAQHVAGKDAHGAALTVVEAHFGLKDKPTDAPDSGCDGMADQAGNGGTEYWLLAAKPVKALALCNDGYGAAGVGEDAVTFAANRLTHVQSGGSNWRWTSTDVYSLSPFRKLNELACSYFDAGPQGTLTFSDYEKFTAVTLANDFSHQRGEDDIGCPTGSAAMFASPKPRPDTKTLAAFAVLTPADGDTQFANIAAGTTLGSCATSISTDGKAGFLVFGQPATAASTAQLRVLSPSARSLMLQVYDPAPASAPAGKSWIAASHAEIWILTNSDTTKPLTRADLLQVAVDLDGNVNVSTGAETPQVQHWRAKDEQGRPVTVLLLRWKEDFTLPIGTAVSYSQAEGGRQARLTATTGMNRGVPLLVPGIVGMQNGCSVAAGRLVLR